MCFDEGTLMAYLDGELPASERSGIETHVRECAECRTLVAGLRADRDAAAEALAQLRPGIPVVPLASARPRPAHLSRYLAAAAAALVLVSFAFAPVRSAAAQFLQIFRVQQVKTVTFTSDDIAQMQKAFESGAGRIDLKSLGEVSVEGGAGAPKPVTLAQAQQALDFPVKLPAGAGEPTMTLQPAQTLKFKLHVDAVNAVLREYGSERVLPDSVDGKVFEVRTPAVLLAGYGGAGVPNDPSDPDDRAMAAQGELIAVQARSPELVVPDGVDMAQLRDVLVNLPFLPANVRDQLAGIEDWRTTMLVPNIDGSSTEVTIDGRPAVVISADGAARSARAKVGGGDIPEHLNWVLWQADGVTRTVGGPITKDQAVEMAKSMMR